LMLIENSLVRSLGWPEWALRSIEGLSVAVLLLFVIDIAFLSSAANPKDVKKPAAESASFRWFQVQYLTVYLITMLADWLQGKIIV